MNQTINMQDVSVVVLAAGLSKRMGAKNKLHLSIDGQALLNHAVNNFLRAGLQNIVVVLGHQHEHTAALMQDKEVTCIVNDHYSKGQVSSVRCGLAKVATNSRAVFMALGDQPQVSLETIKMLLENYVGAIENQETVQALVPYFRGSRGNPVLISNQARQEILAGSNEFGCREFMDCNPELVRKLEVDDRGVVTDLDTPEDYQRYLNSYQY